MNCIGEKPMKGRTPSVAEPNVFGESSDAPGREPNNPEGGPRGKLVSPVKRATRPQGRVAMRWGREDSNLRRLSRRVYSPFPLAARAHPQGAGIVASRRRGAACGAVIAKGRRPPGRSMFGILMDLNNLLRSAVELGASDIHLKVGQPPILRRDGDLAPMEGF